VDCHGNTVNKNLKKYHMHNFHITHHIRDNGQNDKLDNLYTYVHSMYDSLCRGVNVDYVCLSVRSICELVVCLDGSWYE
jgi:hypothetical protein